MSIKTNKYARVTRAAGNSIVISIPYQFEFAKEGELVWVTHDEENKRIILTKVEG